MGWEKKSLSELADTPFDCSDEMIERGVDNFKNVLENIGVFDTPHAGKVRKKSASKTKSSKVGDTIHSSNETDATFENTAAALAHSNV